MSGERDLSRLLAGMSARRQPGVFRFCTLPEGELQPDVRALASFEEAEGLTLVVEESEAEAFGLTGDFRAAWIVLEIQSDLAAVGFLAAVSRALADEGIACNAIAAYHHDHLFVPVERADDALAALDRLERSAERGGVEA